MLETLKLIIKKQTLMELVYPHVIQSTRFLRSKLPGSQTMIAFMRSVLSFHIFRTSVEHSFKNGNTRSGRRRHSASQWENGTRMGR
jgi:hypothetical protein